MIPKILHYVWVGGNKKPKNIPKPPNLGIGLL